MEYLPFILAALLSVLLFLSAWKFGVVDQLSGSLAAAGGIAVGLLAFVWIPRLLDSWIGLSFPVTFITVASLILGILALGILKFVFNGIFKALFNADSVLYNVGDGFFGALISLVPIAILLFVMASGTRLVGTMMELRMVQHVSDPDHSFTKKTYPDWPITARWRDKIESTPIVGNLLQMTDPISKKEVRNLAALLLISRNQPMLDGLKADPKAGGIVESDEFTGLLEDETISGLIKNKNRPALVSNSDVRSTAAAATIQSDLAKLPLRQVIEAYKLSAPILEEAEGRKRDPVPEPEEPGPEPEPEKPEKKKQVDPDDPFDLP